jgi:hypothetical protein
MPEVDVDTSIGTASPHERRALAVLQLGDLVIIRPQQAAMRMPPYIWEL